jgi:colanic acid biosynthesis glycosyl transferase WcaI
MAKVTFLSLVFPPDSVSTAQIMGELAIELNKLGHDVNVITTTPHYNRDLEAEEKQPLKNYVGGILRKSKYYGMPVYHVWMPQKGPNIVLRILAWINFHLINTIASVILLKKPDILLVPSPPLTMGVNAWLISLFKKSKFIYNVQEIYPDYAINIGAVHNKILIDFFFRLEAFVYKKATMLTVIAPNMADLLAHKGVSPKKIKIIPNFVDVDELHPLPKKNAFSEQYGLDGKFVVSYAGNMGPGQDLDAFIESASLLSGYHMIHFLMMGDGMLCDRFKKKIEELRLDNFTFLDYQPYSLMLQIYASSDLCLVPQSKEIINAAVPSKVYRIMACARPVLATTRHGSDLARLINDANCGLISDSGSAKKLAEAVLSAEHDREHLRIMGESGRKYVVNNFSRQSIAKEYHELILSILSRRSTEKT